LTVQNKLGMSRFKAHYAGIAVHSLMSIFNNHQVISKIMAYILCFWHIMTHFNK